MNPYKVLGVKSSDTKEKIKKQYRKLAKKYHPDTGGDPEKFHEIQKAWELIKSPEKLTFMVIFGDDMDSKDLEEIQNSLKTNFMSCILSEHIDNPLVSITNAYTAAIGEINIKIFSNSEQIKLLKSRRKKLNSKLTDNILLLWIDESIVQIESHIDSLEKQIFILKKSKEVLDYFSYDSDSEQNFSRLMSGYGRKSHSEYTSSFF